MLSAIAVPIGAKGGVDMDKLGLGRKMERLVMAHDEYDGYNCWQPPRAKYTSQDIWGNFDYIAVKPWHPVKCVQVKRYRAKELVVAFNAIKAFADYNHAPIRCFLVYWRRNADKRITFTAWEYGLTGWFPAGEWTE